MANFLKVIEEEHKNGVVDVKTFEAIRRALFIKLKFGVIRAQGLGDVLMCAPVMKALKERNPGSEITLYSFPQYLPLMKRFGFIDHLRTLEEIDTRDVIIDLMGKIDYLPLCNKAHRVELLADEAAIPRDEVDYSFFFAPTEEETAWGKQFLKSKGAEGKLIGIHLKSYADIRTWDGSWDLLRLLLRRLPKVYKILLFEKEATEVPKDIRSSRVVNLTGVPTVTQLVPLVAACEVLVAPDSGLMHLAGMMRVPCIALFGPIDPDFRTRYYPTVEAIWLKELPCAPCWDWQIGACAKPGDHKKCMRGISAEMVFERVKRRL